MSDGVQKALTSARALQTPNASPGRPAAPASPRKVHVPQVNTTTAADRAAKIRQNRRTARPRKYSSPATAHAGCPMSPCGSHDHPVTRLHSAWGSAWAMPRAGGDGAVGSRCESARTTTFSLSPHTLKRLTMFRKANRTGPSVFVGMLVTGVHRGAGAGHSSRPALTGPGESKVGPIRCAGT